MKTNNKLVNKTYKKVLIKFSKEFKEIGRFCNIDFNLMPDWANLFKNNSGIIDSETIIADFIIRAKFKNNVELKFKNYAASKISLLNGLIAFYLSGAFSGTVFSNNTMNYTNLILIKILLVD